MAATAAGVDAKGRLNNDSFSEHLVKGTGGDGTTPEPYMCRICFDETTEVGELVTPCDCIGTQKYVHFKCLRKWQENVVLNSSSLDGYDERAVKCSVCQATFSIPPPRASVGIRVASFLRGAGGALCLSLLAFGLSGPPWPHLALMVLLLLGTRSHSILVLAVLLAGSVLAALHARGMRVVMRVDGMGRLGLVLIRHGTHVEALEPGVLLVASADLENSIFRRSVVLIYEHSASGASGVILTKSLDAGLAQEYLEGDPIRHPTVSHFVGGPVGTAYPGSHANTKALLHSVPNVPGSIEVPVHGGQQWFVSLQPRSAIQHINSPQDNFTTPLAEGHSAPPPYHEEDEDSARPAGRRGSGPADQLRLFHGISSWADGQLEGEIRSGSWGFCRATRADLLSSHVDLWDRLVVTPRLQWL